MIKITSLYRFKKKFLHTINLAYIVSVTIFPEIRSYNRPNKIKSIIPVKFMLRKVIS